MPRRSRIDAAGALQPVMVRGIERGRIFQNDADRTGDKDGLSLMLYLLIGGSKTVTLTAIERHKDLYLLQRTR
jgi:hypothetical protein